ncbi:MAG: hypothetical protein KY433_08475, partial [Actinobacteria bacterium]|nr:hypothetical protein [Actinomycetota bacterium]
DLYDRMTDKTIKVPSIAAGLAKDKSPAEREQWAAQNLDEDGGMKVLPPNHPSAFRFGDYVFLYEDLIDASDDHKNTVTAQVSIWKAGENLGRVYPAKWDYRKGSEATTEVAIKVRSTEDVYVVLTGYELESKLANFRVFINPLISWVWVGFLLLALGVFVCLFPPSLIARIYGKRSMIGRAAGDISILVIVAGAIVAATPSDAKQPACCSPACGRQSARSSAGNTHAYGSSSQSGCSWPWRRTCASARSIESARTGSP